MSPNLMQNSFHFQLMAEQFGMPFVKQQRLSTNAPLVGTTDQTNPKTEREREIFAPLL
jgi:hypothetical protein